MVVGPLRRCCWRPTGPSESRAPACSPSGAASGQATTSSSPGSRCASCRRRSAARSARRAQPPLPLPERSPPANGSRGMASTDYSDGLVTCGPCPTDSKNLLSGMWPRPWRGTRGRWMSASGTGSTVGTGTQGSWWSDAVEQARGRCCSMTGMFERASTLAARRCEVIWCGAKEPDGKRPPPSPSARPAATQRDRDTLPGSHKCCQSDQIRPNQIKSDQIRSCRFLASADLRPPAVPSPPVTFPCVRVSGEGGPAGCFHWGARESAVRRREVVRRPSRNLRRGIELPSSQVRPYLSHRSSMSNMSVYAHLSNF